MIKITDINDSRIALYKSLRNTPETHTREKLFVTEGSKVTESLLKSGFEIVSFFAQKEFYEKFDALLKAKNINEQNMFVADKDLMNQIVGYKLHSGIMAIARQAQNVDLNELKPPVIVLNKIINTENVGAIIRNCTAFGVNSIIVDEETCNPFMRRSVRVSMGTIFSIKIHFSENILQTVNQLKNEFSMNIFAAEIVDNAKNIDNFIFPDNMALIFGSENNGISEDILMICDEIIQVPIVKSTNSINVAASSAIFLYKISNRNVYK